MPVVFRAGNAGVPVYFAAFSVRPIHTMSPARAPERIGLYGGSFDPVHLGHLILARDALEQLGLARLVFIPAAISPHKLGRAPGASGADRLDMLAAAVAGEPLFSVDGRELGRAGPSYTVDTIHELRAEGPEDAEFFYLIGEDNVPALDTWHRVAELRSLVQFVVCHRHAPTAGFPAGPAGFAAGPHGFPVVARWLDISSTEVRNRVAAGRSIRYLLPEGVQEIIDTRKLYRTSVQSSGGTPPSPPNR